MSFSSTPPTILERAAMVWEKRRRLEEATTRLRELEGDWTTHAIAADEAMAIGVSGLQHAWTMLDRLLQLAEQDIARQESDKDTPLPTTPAAQPTKEN